MRKNNAIKIWVFIMTLLSSSLVSAAQSCSLGDALVTPSSRFTVNSDGTVIDNLTNLMWQRCSAGLAGNNCDVGLLSTTPWLTAVVIAKDSQFAGHTDWRLPNIKELASIVERSCDDPSINTEIFPNTLASEYWSSTPLASFSNQSWQVEFDTGEDTFNLRTTSAAVRIVRDLD